MAEKKEHHYVPKLYLRNFASNPNRINVLRIHPILARADVGLKEQCRRTRFYGKDNILENKLERFEGKVAPILSGVIQTSRLPRPQSADHRLLTQFIALQSLRTPKLAQSMNDSMKQVVKLSFGADPPEGIKLLGDSRYTPSELIGIVADISTVYATLELHLVLNRGGIRFVTSDNPTVRYNQYCEGITDYGVLGARSKGLLVFTPVSPTHLLLIYDKDVYKIGEMDSVSTEVYCQSAINAINSLQVVFSDEVILFSDWADASTIEDLIESVFAHRKSYHSHASEYVNTADPKHSSLLHFFEKMPNLELTLPFMSLRRLASKVPLNDRTLKHRSLPTDRGDSQAIRFGGRKRTFRLKEGT